MVKPLSRARRKFFASPAEDSVGHPPDKPGNGVSIRRGVGQQDAELWKEETWIGDRGSERLAH